MIRRAATWGAIVLAMTASACRPKAAPSWHQETGYRWRELDVDGGRPGFTRMSDNTTRIHFQNNVSDSALLRNRVLEQGAGVALGDVDGDGRVDVFLARTEGCSALYKNLGDWRFQDVTKTAGVGACDRNSTGATFADVDGDGDLDLVLVATRGPNAIFVNDGRGHFTEHRDLGLDPQGKGATTVTMADVDGDGRLDLYVANYKAYSFEDSVPPSRREYRRMMRQVAPGRYEVAPEYRAEYKLVTRPDMGGLRMTARGAPDDFYLNTGGRFERVPFTSSRFLDANGHRLPDEPESFTLDAKLVDLNGDGAPDLYATNDFEDLDQLWYNDGHGNFRLADWRAQRQVSNSAMGMDAADVSGDGRPDLFVVDMLGENSHRAKTEIPTHTALPKTPGEIDVELQQQRNTLFVNRGDDTFVEVGAFAGVQGTGWSWSTMFIDVDLDGWQDILVANGHVWDIMDGDAQERLADPTWRKSRSQFPPLRQKNVAFRNHGDLTFENVSERWRFGTEDDMSHGMAAADLDGDGDLDVIVNRLRAPALVLRNDASAPRIAVQLVGDAPNTRAVGAKIRLLGGAIPLQVREVVAGGLYLSHSDYETSFAMGKSDSATLVVDWRDGRRTTIEHVRPNRLYEITAATARVRPSADSSAGKPTLFVDATSELGGHRHTEPPFDDWNLHPLLPNALSRLGPGVTWFDYDGDGDEDLIVGAGRGERLGVFRNDQGRLVPQPSQGPLAPADVGTILGLPSAEPRGGSRLLIGLSNWEGERVPALVSANAVGGSVATSTEQVIPLTLTTIGPIALGDYDGDGDLDLFIGGRAMSSTYPAPTSSALYRNEGGTFVRDTVNGNILRDIGLVSAAMFADVDGDGHPDLVLAREWDSLVLLLNNAGRFTKASPSWGLDRWTSRWNGIAAGDLDGDGRLDLIATSWGRNTMTPADSGNPLVVLYGQFGSSGEQSMLLARKDPRLGDLAPLNGYPSVRDAISDLRSRAGTFAAYADATVDQVLGPFKDRVQKKSVITLDQMLFLNRGDHFEASPFPLEAQLAPASYAGVADFDGDGNEDVFLSQNFYPTALGLPRYDGGRGLLLTGNGTGRLTPVDGAQSGILVYGDQRGAAYADADGDGRLDLVVSENGAATRFFRNRGAKPGLRVRLQGPPGNRDGVGAQIRLVYGGKFGPVREVQAGSGYWSQNGAVQVLGLTATPTNVWVRWPGGRVTTTPVPAGAREVVVSSPSP